MYWHALGPFALGLLLGIVAARVVHRVMGPGGETGRPLTAHDLDASVGL